MQRLRNEGINAQTVSSEPQLEFDVETACCTERVYFDIP